MADDGGLDAAQVEGPGAQSSLHAVWVRPRVFHQRTTVADEVHADAIVVGASEQRIGSLAVRLVRDGRWPVTVVP